VRAVAVLGDGASLSEAARLAEVNDDQAARGADLLVALAILKPGESLEFVHPIVREAVYADIGSHERAAAHARAAVLLEASGAAEERIAAQIVEAEPFVDADDIADVAVAALTQDGHTGQLYELTGPRLLTFAEATEEIATATGRDIRYVPVPLDAFASALAAQGVPGEVIDLLTYLYSEVLDGRNAHLADGVQRALGRDPRDFADYAREAAATGVWDAPVQAWRA
jgi:hypothetical protein